MNPTQVEYFTHSLYNSNVMRELLKYLKKYRIECVIAPLFKALEAGFELLVPLVIAYIIDKGIPARDQSRIIRSGTTFSPNFCIFHFPKSMKSALQP